MTKKQASIATYIIAGVIIIGLIVVFSSCKTNTVYVPVESVKTEYRDKHTRDSVYLHDSIVMKMKGDTVWLEKYKYFYRDKLVRDSIFLTDSIQVPFPIETIKEINRLKWWQEILIYLGVLCVGIVGYRVYRWVK